MTSSLPQPILDHFEDPYHRGPLDEATHVAESSIPICADRIRIELRISASEVIEEAGFDGEGCVLCQAAASMLVEQIEGREVAEVRQFSSADMLALVGETDVAPSRQKCCLLSWRVLQTALHSPVDDEEEGLRFGGPSLREEC